MSSYTGQVDVEFILGMSVQSAIAEFKDDPVGLGNDYFLINETFMVGVRKYNFMTSTEKHPCISIYITIKLCIYFF